MSTKQAILDKATSLGLDVCGIAPPDLPEADRLGLIDFLQNDYEGDMGWLAERRELRTNPQAMVPELGSIIAVGINYGPEADPMALLDAPDKGIISVYAQNRDYHDVLKGKLKQLGQFIVSRFGGDIKVFVDTAPVMEKPLAAQSGIGWQGKHTCLVSREYGSWLFLGIIYTTLKLPPDEAEADHCGSCTRCLDVCPTDAFVGAHKLDARRCISYLTIEHQGHIAREFRNAMQNRIYGCDDCLAVCPWNKFAEQASEQKFHARSELKAPALTDLLMLDDAAFRRLFSGSPIKRIGRDRFIRNVLIASGNSGDRSLIPQIEALLKDASALVRAMAVWALGELADAAQFTSYKTLHAPDEQDADVLKEWEGSDTIPSHNLDS